MVWFPDSDILSPNIALNKTATQISTMTWDNYLMEAKYAIDGNMRGDVVTTGDNYAHTAMETGAWWQVDLHWLYKIEKTAITSRSDSDFGVCCLSGKSHVTDRVLFP